jgi:hypothetical protein
MKQITVRQSVAKIAVIIAVAAVGTALVSAAISCSWRQAIDANCFTGKTEEFILLNACAGPLLFLLIAFYEKQFVTISATTLKIGNRLGRAANIAIDDISRVSENALRIEVAMRNGNNVYIYRWRFKKSDLDEVNKMLPHVTPEGKRARLK